MVNERMTIAKASTGIKGLDEITLGGLPVGRSTLIAGSAGSGKTMLGMQFLVHGMTHEGEPGVFMAFEETADELAANFASLGVDLKDLVARGQLALDHVHVQRSEFEVTGEYDLEGLFIRLNHAIESVGAKRVVLDTVETLFGGLPNPAILRAELHRLFEWLRDRQVTAIITGETGHGTITRQGLEEYVSDCVIQLTHSVADGISTRRLRVVKYRGSAHGTNEYPFLIDEHGVSVLPITSLSLDQPASTDIVSTGIDGLDGMFALGGYYRGTSVLVSGTAGTGKSSIAAKFADAACARGERALYVSFEESQQQLIRNMSSIGLDLQNWVDKGLLHFHSSRATLFGLEMHLVTLSNLVRELDPSVVIVDPMTSLLSMGTAREVQSALTRLIDLLKTRGTTGLFTSLVSAVEMTDRTEESVSSLMDTWLLLRNVEYNGERNRMLYLLKSRGMAHSNQVREFILTDNGVRLEDVYVGEEGVYTGSARVAKQAGETAARELRLLEAEARERELERKRAVLDTRIREMQAEFAAEEAQCKQAVEQSKAEQLLLEERQMKVRERRLSPGSAEAPDAGAPR